MVPKIDFSADSYEKLVDFDTCEPAVTKAKQYSSKVEFTAPPILSEYEIEEIKNLQFKDSFQKIPCHSQTCERFVAWTSEAALNTIGYENCHGHILNKKKSTEKISTHPKKMQFVECANARRQLFDDEKEK